MMEGSKKRGSLWRTHSTRAGLNSRLGERKLSFVCGLCFSWTLLFGLSSAGAVHSEIVPSGDISQPVEMYQVASSNINIQDSSSTSKLAVNPQITTDKLKQAGFILPDTASVSSIIGSVIPSSALHTGSYVFINIGKEHGAIEGDSFTIFNKDLLIRHPEYKVPPNEDALTFQRPFGVSRVPYFTEVGKPMGYLVEILGTLTIVETDQKMSKAIVQESYTDIPLGSLLTPYKKTQNPTLTQKPKENMRLEGYIIAVKGNKFAGAMSDLVYADVGRNHNVSPGDRFEAYIIPKNQTQMWDKMDPYAVPMMPHVIGRLQVLAVEDETATMFVEQNHDAVAVGQRIRYKPVKGITPLPDIAALTEAPTYVMNEPQMSEESVTDGSAGSAGNTDDEEIAEPFPFAGAGGANGGAGSNGAGGTDPSGSQQGQIVAEDARLMDFHTTTHLKDVHFKFDRFDFDEASITILKNNAQYLKQNPAIKVQIQGHSDERGTNNYNLALGERRSASIKNFLVSQGVEENRMYVLSYGEEKPFCTENTDVCWEQNRRAHFRVTGDE